MEVGLLWVSYYQRGEIKYLCMYIYTHTYIHRWIGWLDRYIDTYISIQHIIASHL